MEIIKGSINLEDKKAIYHKSKESLNLIYGMCAQNPVHDTWAVWCTSHARNALQWDIDRAGENFVYADTDSVTIWEYTR